MANFETQLLLNLNELEFDTSTELTVEEIKKHYKKLSLYYHPDHNNNEIFKDKQKKINGAKDFLINNLDEVNRYIRRVNYKETDEDKARREKEEWQQQEQERSSYYQQQARQKQEQARQEQARAEQKAKDAEREAEAAKARAAEAEWKAHMAEQARQEEERKRRKTKNIIIALVVIFLVIPFTFGCIMAGVNGFIEGMAEDQKQTEEATNAEPETTVDKESLTMKISDTNLPKTLVKGVEVNWADYYVVYKDADGKEQRVVLSEDMITIDYESFNEQKIEINVNNGSAYLYHNLTVLSSTSIKSASDFKLIATDPKGIYILDADVDLKGVEWTPVVFEGTLIGNGHSIKNLTITSFTTKNVGLFDTIGEKATVSDIKLEGVSIQTASGADSLGALTGLLKGKIENVTVSGSIDAKNSNSVGGIVGTVTSIYASIKNCSFDGSVAGNSFVGGILGGSDESGSVTLDSCTASGSVSATSAAGGIVGSLSNAGNGQEYYVKNCKNNATVSTKLNYCGGVIGKLINSTSWGPPVTEILSCENNGAINGGDYSAGIVGYMHMAGGYSHKGTCNTNANNASITGKNYTGGIIGFNDLEISITESTNNGAIKGEAYVGGFVGYGNYTKISGLSNEKNVEGSYYVGGIAGLAQLCDTCTNKGNITATLYDTKNNRAGVGGIAGLADEVHRSTNSGNVASKSGYGVGGVVGSNATDYYDGNYTNCKNSGIITVDGGAGKGVGGIIGSFIQTGLRNNTLTISVCENTGNINAKAESGIGGIIGYVKTTDKITITSCTSNASIIADECLAVGGIVGVNANSAGQLRAKIESATVSGKITGKKAVGSIIGSLVRKLDNYDTLKITYTVDASITLPHMGDVASES